MINDHFKSTIKPSLFPDKPPISQQLFLQNKPNFKNPPPLLTPETKTTYNDSNPENPQKNKPKTNPKQTQYKAKQTQFFPQILFT